MAKRAFSAFIALIMIISLACCKKEEEIKYESFTASVVLGDTALVDVTYSDEFVTRDNLQYFTDISALCMTLAAATYYSADELEIGLNSLGFSGEESKNYDTDGENKVAYTFARREFNGETTVIAVLRGSQGKEWISNFNMAESAYLNDDNSILEKGYHEGFYLAAQEFLTAFNAYLAKAGNVKNVIITGHSRGGAVSNIAAAEIIKENKYKVFCYAYASPNVKIMNEEDRKDAYNCIFNVVNPEDSFTYMPISQWGFERFGTEIKLDKTSAVAYDKFMSKYEEYNGKAYGGGFENGSSDVAGRFLTLGNKIPDLDTYYKDGNSAYKTMNSFSAIFSGGDVDYTSVLMSAMFNGTADFLKFFMENGEKISEEHMPLTYVSWVMALDE